MIDSICNYNQFISYIKEELIRTLNSDDVIDLLDRKLEGFNFKLTKLHKTQFKIEIFNPDSDINYFKFIFLLCLRCGYYCSYYKILTDNDLIKFKGKFDKEKFINLINKYKITYIYLMFDGDYEDKEYSNMIDIPKLLYHITPQRNKENILKNGLYPKAGMKISFHPERIYLIDNLKNNEFLIDEFKHLDYKYYKNKNKINGSDNINSDFYKYMILEIDTNINNFNEKLILNTDPNFSTYGYFTTNNIPKQNMKIIKENL